MNYAIKSEQAIALLNSVAALKSMAPSTGVEGKLEDVAEDVERATVMILAH